MGDPVAVIHGFVAGEAAVLAVGPGDDGVSLIGSILQHGFAFQARGSSILWQGDLRLMTTLHRQIYEIET